MNSTVLWFFADQDKVDFDVEVAIKVCRNAGYSEHAIELAQKHKLHDWYLQIQLEDNHDYKAGLEYIAKLAPNLAEFHMKKYGGLLIKNLPQETTNLLKNLCNTNSNARPDDFLQLFIRHNEGIIDFLEFVIKNQPKECSEHVYNNLLEHYLHHFKVLNDDPGASNDEKKITENKIMGILSSPYFSYDNDHALVLCQMHDFLRGTLHLYERKGLHSQILKLHIELNDVEAALDTCRKFGPQDPRLWIEALQLIGNVEDQQAKEEHIGEILQVLLMKHFLNFQHVTMQKTMLFDQCLRALKS